MVEREGQVDHVLLVGTAQLVEPLALQELQVTDASSLGEAWGETGGSRSAPSPASLGAPAPTERGTEANPELRKGARLAWKRGKIPGEVDKRPGKRGLVREDMAAGVTISSEGVGRGGLGQFLSPDPCLPLPWFLGGEHGGQLSPVVPEVKMYRQVSIMLWGADK